MTDDPAAHLLPVRRKLMAAWEQGEFVDDELAILDAKIKRLRIKAREESVCGAIHPHKSHLSCTLPEGHGPVSLSGMDWTHASIRDGEEIVWLERLEH